MIIAFLVALIGAPVFGYISDKVENPVILVCISAAVGAISYLVFGISASSDPSASILLFIGIFVGFSEIFMIISAQILVTKKAMPEHMRGTVAGCYSFVGGLGIMVSTFVGGWLFDVWFTGAPFVLATIFNGFIVIVAVYIIFYRRSDTDKWSDKGFNISLPAEISTKKTNNTKTLQNNNTTSHLDRNIDPSQVEQNTKDIVVRDVERSSDLAEECKEESVCDV